MLIRMAYHDALMALKAFKETGKSIKSYLYEFKCSNVQRSLAQVSKTLKHEKKVDDIIERSGLLEREKFLDPCLAKLLVYDACYGTEVKGRFRGIIKRNYTALMEAKKQVEREYPCEIKDENYECPRYALVNTLRSNMDEVKTYLTENLGFEEIQGCSCDNFDKMCEMLRPVLMDKSSCLPAEILQPNPGSDVLDVCAAPGNKTFHLASLYSQAIQIYSIDRSKTRCKLMIKLLTSRNVSPKCVKVYKLNWLKCDQSVLDTELTDFPNGFGYALVDPSCTGSGMLHSRFNTDNTDHDEDRLDMLSSIQFDMIRNCIELYGRSLKRLVYSTCSIHQEENELVVEKVLDSYKAFIELENIMEDTWKYRGLTNRTRGCIRADPKSTRSNGFFVASFRFLR